MPKKGRHETKGVRGAIRKSTKTGTFRETRRDKPTGAADSTKKITPTKKK